MYSVLAFFRTSQKIICIHRILLDFFLVLFCDDYQKLRSKLNELVARSNIK